MRWTGFESTDELYALLLLNRARDWQEVRQALRHFEVPGQNVVFADRAGNIAYQAAVRLPIRGKHNPTLPLPGWESEFDWRGFVPFSRLPFSLNPPGGYLATANNDPVDDRYPFHISDLWEPPSRIVRLTELLESGGPYSPADVQRVQLDTVSPHAQETVPVLLRAFANETVEDTLLQTALNYFRNWDFDFRKDDVATSIFNVFYVRLLWNTFHDEMGQDLFHDYVYLATVPTRVMSSLLQTADSPWFDDITTEGIETRDQVIRRSLTDALEELQVAIGPELKTWSWGSIHQVTFHHILGTRKPLDAIVDIGPFSVGGAASTLNKGEYNLNSPFTMTIGPSFRHITDLADTAKSLMVITTGESGQPLHRHYEDQSPLWLNGLYHRVILDVGEVRSQTGWDLLVLAPEEGGG